MDGEIDGAAAAPSLQVVEELRAADVDHRVLPFPALAVARVAPVAEPFGDMLEGYAPQVLPVFAAAHGGLLRPSSSLAWAT